MNSIESSLIEGIDIANKILAYITDGTPKDKESIQKTVDKALLATQLIPLFERQLLQNLNKNYLITTFESFVLTAKKIIWQVKNNSGFNSIANAESPNYNLLVAQESIIERAESAVRSALGKRPAEINVDIIDPLQKEIEHKMALAPIHLSSSKEEAPMEITDEPQKVPQGFGRKSARIRKATEEIVSHAPVKRRKVSSKKEAPPIPVLSQEAMDDIRPLKDVIESMTVEARGGVNKEYRISPNFDRFQAKFFHAEKITWSEYFRGVLEKDVDQRVKKKFEIFKKSREQGESSDFRIEMQPVLGNVLFTTKKIKKGTIIDEYSGQIIKCDHSHKKNVYLFEFDTQHTIITEYGTDGEVVCNKSSFIAHNTEKYCNVKPVIYYDKEGPHVLFEAIRDIEPGEAITFNYGKKYWTHLDIKPITWDPTKR